MIRLDNTGWGSIDMDDYMVVTHTDMDGVGSAAVYIHYRGYKPSKIMFTEPYLLTKAFKKISKIRNVRTIAFMDLGMNQKTYEYIKPILEKKIAEGIEIEWYDHHIWDKEWLDNFREIGVKINIDNTICAAGVVAKYAPRRSNINKEFIEEFVKGVCSGDLWRFDHWLGPWYLRLIRRDDPDSWREEVLNTILKEKLWDKSFDTILIDRVEKEINSYKELVRLVKLKRIDGVLFAFVKANKYIENSFAAAYIMARKNAEVVAVISDKGKVSLRSKEINIREIAKALGGGGHPHASGFAVKIPIIIRIKKLFSETAVLDYIMNKIISVAPQYLS